MKDKEGNKITRKEFMTRWKEGIEGITPLQKINTQITATRIQIFGLICGLVMTGIAYKNLWWVTIVLLGALINTGVQYLGLTQQRNSLKKHEDNCDEMSLDDLMKDNDEDITISLDGEEAKGMSEIGISIKTKGGKTC